MEHLPLHWVKAFSIVGPYQLDVTFEDGFTQRVDLSGILHGQVFGPLRDLAVFNAVRLDEELENLVWPNGADFDPSSLYYWPEVKDGMIARAQQWAEREQQGR